MGHAIRIYRNGGPEVVRWEKVEDAADAHRDLEAAVHAGSLLLVP